MNNKNRKSRRIIQIIFSFILAFGFLGVYPGFNTPLSDNFTFKIYAEETDIYPYYCNSLTSSQKKLFEHIYNAAADFRSDTVINYRVSGSDLSLIADLLYYYDPLMFNLSALNAEMYMNSTVVYINYRSSKTEYSNKINKINENAGKIIQSIPDGLDTYGKIKYLHDYIAQNCSYDINAEDADNPYGVLVNGAAKCDGYAKTFSFLCGKLGIESVPVIGADITEGNADHMWNKLYYNNKWYNIDVTYDDIISVFTDNIRYNYFMVSDNTMKNSHKQTDVSFDIPSASDDSMAYYKLNENRAEKLSDTVKALKKSLLQASENNKFIATVQFSSKSDYDKAYKQLITDKKIYSVLKSANKEAVNKFCDNIYLSSRKDNTYTIDIIIFYPRTPLEMYYTDPDSVSEKTKKALIKYGIK